MKKNKIKKTLSTNHIRKPLLYTTVFLLFATCLLPLTHASTPALQLPHESVTMIASDGCNSYFDIELSDVPPDFDVTDGYYEGWCADRAEVMPRGEILSVRLYSSIDPTIPTNLRHKDWGKINYILNNDNNAAMHDVQDAFWNILCDYPYEYLSESAKTLVNTAQSDFIPQSDDLIAVILNPVHNDSNPWPFQIAFIQIILTSQEQPDDDDEPIITPKRISHGLHYNTLTPIAKTNGPYDGIISQTIEFDGSASYDPDGIIIFYKWNLGDGTVAEEKTTTHNYKHPGVYQISLQVIDNFGIKNTTTTTANIIQPNRPPTQLIIAGIINGTQNNQYSYVFSASDEDDDKITYTIDWGDDSSNQTGALLSGEYFSFYHQWDNPGAYTITLTASDGQEISIFKKEVIIHETPLTDNIWIIGLAILALIAFLAILLYSRKKSH
jgi:hypothetical protein